MAATIAMIAVTTTARGIAAVIAQTDKIHADPGAAGKTGTVTVRTNATTSGTNETTATADATATIATAMIAIATTVGTAIGTVRIVVVSIVGMITVVAVGGTRIVVAATIAMIAVTTTAMGIAAVIAQTDKIHADPDVAGEPNMTKTIARPHGRDVIRSSPTRYRIKTLMLNRVVGSRRSQGTTRR